MREVKRSEEEGEKGGCTYFRFRRSARKRRRKRKKQWKGVVRPSGVKTLKHARQALKEAWWSAPKGTSLGPNASISKVVSKAQISVSIFSSFLTAIHTFLAPKTSINLQKEAENNFFESNQSSLNRIDYKSWRQWWTPACRTRQVRTQIVRSRNTTLPRLQSLQRYVRFVCLFLINSGVVTVCPFIY